ncbi:MAG: AAA family ATPase [Proteiniphilum sp.]|nr:AAA family ATPase [Proteiniphilum sp.]
MPLLITSLRVCGFRGLSNVELSLEPTTVLTGVNNSGKTSLLKAMQVAFGNPSFLTRDDFTVNEHEQSTKVIVDTLIISTNDPKQFPDVWEELLTTKRIITDDPELSYVPIRSVVIYDSVSASCKFKQYILRQWPAYSTSIEPTWQNEDNGIEMPSRFEEIPFFYIDAQRDIMEDIKLRTSFLGRIISSIEYSKKQVEDIELMIKNLNEATISGSGVLSVLQDTLKGVAVLVGDGQGEIEVTPFTKKLRDLNKGISITYKEQTTSFPLELHGMGTRSWTSLLTLKTLLSLLHGVAEKGNKPFYPILCIEEPESHLHPHAQKALYDQLNEMPGQKIISTHSPFIAAQAKLKELRSVTHKRNEVLIGKIPIDAIDADAARKIQQKVIKTRGEMLFAKVIVFFEGETEELALPILAEKFFGTSEMLNISFIGVGGYGSYAPFLRVAESLNIPWFVFSDNEKVAEQSVKNQVKDTNPDTCIADKVVFLPSNMNFEKYLLSEKYHEAVRKSIIQSECFQNEQHRCAKTETISKYSEAELLEAMKHNKTQMGALIAENIVNNQMALPGKVSDLFNKVKVILGA